MIPVVTVNTQNMGYELFLNQIFLSFLVWYPLVLNPFLPGSGSRSVAFLSGSGSVWKFILDPDPYESSVWIRIRNEFFQLLDPDPSQTNKDPPHCIQVPYGSVILVFSLAKHAAVSVIQKLPSDGNFFTCNAPSCTVIVIQNFPSQQSFFHFQSAQLSVSYRTSQLRYFF